jgi:hypothetical protein
MLIAIYPEDLTIGKMKAMNPVNPIIVCRLSLLNQVLLISEKYTH